MSLKTGDRIGRLVCVREARHPIDQRPSWLCVCDCGNQKVVRAKHLKAFLIQSCGCFRKEKCARTHLKHGLSKTKIYSVWCAMVERCTKPKSAGFRYYGARGIKVCRRWRRFENFFSDMGHAPKGLTLDRENNDGPYSPQNCRWATRSQQSKNSRPSWHKRKRNALGQFN